MIERIDQLDIHGKKVFIRTDYNVQVKDGKIVDDLRIRSSLPTLEYAIAQKAKIIIGSHMGRPKGVYKEELSLLPVAEHLAELLNREVLFPEDCIGDGIKKLVSEMREGDVILLENLRFHPEEQSNDPNFSQQLANFAEVYINDAFGTVHRAHASTVGMISHFKTRGIGFLVDKEISHLNQLLGEPHKPFFAVLGGSKVSDKIGVIDNLLRHVHCLLIGGAMAYTFLKAKGVDVGNSLVEDAKLHQAEKTMKHAESLGVDLVLPCDSVVSPSLDGTRGHRVVSHKEPWGNDIGVDIGPQTVELFKQKLLGAKTIFWNGPMGVFETPPFNQGTFALAKIIAQIPNSIKVVGGGHSVSAVRQSGFADQFTHLSTGGGASMDFLEGKPLPGLRALDLK